MPLERSHEKIIDLFERRTHYLEVVRELRHVLNERYSYATRIRELLEIVSN